MAYDLMSICFTMKDAVFAAGDVLMQEQGSATAAGDAAALVLLDGWFGTTHDELVILQGEAAQIAQQDAQQYRINDFVGNVAKYMGPVFFVCGLCGGVAHMRGLTGFCVAIVFVQNGRLSAAAVYDPVHVAFFHAADGMGAYRNGARIGTSSVTQLADAFVTIDPELLKTADVHALQRLAQATVLRTEDTCALALCHVACGRADAAVCAGHSFAELAAGCLIAREAGASLKDLKGGALALKPGAKQGAAAASLGIALALTAITARF